MILSIRIGVIYVVRKGVMDLRMDLRTYLQTDGQTLLQRYVLNEAKNALHDLIPGCNNCFCFYADSTECAYLSNAFLEEQIDGQAFMLLNLPTVQQHLGLKIGPAIRLCHIIERVKLGFFLSYCPRDDDDDEDDDDDDDDDDVDDQDDEIGDICEEDKLNVPPVDDEFTDTSVNVTERSEPTSLSV